MRNWNQTAKFAYNGWAFERLVVQMARREATACDSRCDKQECSHGAAKALLAWLKEQGRAEYISEWLGARALRRLKTLWLIVQDKR
jgi:hypothetical protein